MKKLFIIPAFFASVAIYAQDDLQAVTARGNTTNRSLVLQNPLNTSHSGFLGFTNGSFYFDTYNSSNNTRPEMLLQPYGGNVGIGTLYPAAKLDVAGFILSNGYSANGQSTPGSSPVSNISNINNGLRINGDIPDHSQNGITYQSGSGGGAAISFYRKGSYETGMDFYTNSVASPGNIVHRMRLSDYGYLGIGTDAPDQVLTIKGGGIGFDHNSADKKLYSPVDGVLEWMTHNLAGEHGFAVSHQGVKSVYFNTSGNSYLTGGNLGLGTSSPLAKVHIVNVPENSQIGSTLILGPTTGANLRMGYNTGYSWLQSHGGLPLYINEVGNDVVFNLAGGKVGIGTASPQSELAVKGTITSQKVKVTLNGWADYVFDSSYRLLPLQQVEKYIQSNRHLPDVPSAADVEKEGLDLGDNQALLLKKIEELTLYIIAQDKELSEEKKRNNMLSTRLSAIEDMLKDLKK